MDFPIIIKIPRYIREINVSEKQRAKYYEWDGRDIKSKSKKLLQKYIAQERRIIIYEREGRVFPSDLRLNYNIGVFDKKGKLMFSSCSDDMPLQVGHKYILCHSDTNEKVIANQTQVGKPKREIIKGQNMYSQAYHPVTRAKIITAIKESFLPYVQQMPIIDEYPITIDLELWDTVKNVYGTKKDSDNLGQRWDIGNRCYPYGKAFLDLIATGKTSNDSPQYFKPKIVDDDRLHVTRDPQGGIFCPLPTHDDKDRCLVFIINKDDRDIIKNNPYYNKEFILTFKEPYDTGNIIRQKEFKINKIIE